MENNNNQTYKKIKTIHLLQKFHLEDNTILEIGLDEAGRGPLFGRVYAAAVILPKDDSFEHSKMKDSKKFHSQKKMEETAEYIKMHALAWYISYEEETIIDEINILQATQKCMHTCIHEIRKQINLKEINSFHLLIDGNYFNPLEDIPYTTVEGGDNKYSCIAAASILAKVERDKYIEKLCIQKPELIEKYDLASNKGYGAKKHIEGIKKYGIIKGHRKTFGICKSFS
jgi:ribonuclease HII